MFIHFLETYSLTVLLKLHLENILALIGDLLGAGAHRDIRHTNVSITTLLKRIRLITLGPASLTYVTLLRTLSQYSLETKPPYLRVLFASNLIGHLSLAIRRISTM